MKESNLMISKEKIFCFFLALIVITPAYIDGPGGVAIYNYLLIIGLVYSCWGMKIKKPIHMRFYFIYAIVFCLINIYHERYTASLWDTMFIFVIILALNNYIQSKDCFLRCIDMLIYPVFPISILGILEYFTEKNFFQLLNNSGVVINLSESRFSMTRIMGFTGMTINYGMYLFFICGLIIYRLSHMGKSNKQLFFWVTYVLAAINIFMTMSRTCILAFLGSQIILLPIAFGAKYLIMGLLMSMVCMLGIVFIEISKLGGNLLTSISNMFFMIMAVFNSGFSSNISSTFGGNLGGVGNRFDLYGWVWEKVADSRWLGQTDAFFYRTLMDNGYWLEKWSIEVNYLNVLYYNGIIGLVAEISLFLRTIFVSLKSRCKVWEKKLSFKFVVLCLMFFCIISMFMVSLQEEKRVLIIIIILCQIYSDSEEKGIVDGF